MLECMPCVAVADKTLMRCYSAPVSSLATSVTSYPFSSYCLSCFFSVVVPVCRRCSCVPSNGRETLSGT